MIRSDHLTQQSFSTKRRRIRLLLAAPIAVALTVVGGDQLVGAWGEHSIATRIQQQHQLTDRPEATIGGVPKGWQVMSGSMDRVAVHAVDFPVETTRAPMTVTSLDVSAQQVTRIGSAQWRARSAHAEAFISYEDLSRSLGVSVRQSDSGGGVHLTSTLPVAGEVGANVDVDVASDSAIRLSSPVFDRQRPPEILRLAVNRIVARPLQLSSIPAGMRLSSVDAREGGVRVSLVGSHVTVET